MSESETANKLLQKAVRALARKSFSRGELEARLRSGADAEDVNHVLERLEELNLLNDEQYAYNFALWRMKQDGWGPAKVLHALLARHVEERLAQTAIERVRKEAGDAPLLEEYLRGFAGKHGLPRDRKSIQKLILRLQRRGFPDEVIRRVLGQVIPAAAWQRFETGE